MSRSLTFLFLLIFSGLTTAKDIRPPRNLAADAGNILAPVAVQNAGRPKPLDSFARFNLLDCYHKSKINKLSASQWLAQLTLDPDTAYQVKCFRLRNEDLIADLGLKGNKEQLYSFDQLRDKIDDQRDRLIAISQRDAESHTLIESQFLKLNSTVRGYFSISRSFTCLTPEISITNQQLADELKIERGKLLSFFQLHQRWGTLRTSVEKINKDFDQNNPYHNAVFELASRLKNMQQHESQLGTIAIIPSAKNPITETWLTPWQALDPQHAITEREIKLLTELEAAINALIVNDSANAQKHIDNFQELVPQNIKSLTKKELFYNKLDAFTKSIAFYLLGFLFLCLSWVVAGKQLRWTSWSLVLVGLLLHTTGIAVRMMIRGRPAPVTNIYESIIFVGFAFVLLGLIIEFVRRDGLGLIIAIIPGCILHFVGFRYELDGDTMGRLVAVLDSNFWLSTHVVTITFGYGAAGVAGFIALIYLYIRLFKPHDKELHKGLAISSIGSAIFALLFCIVGTILGGIWGDQSWGRFWGWDPKENGALLICLWLLIILHGKWGKQLKNLGIATMLSLTNITVLLAWFGVNLLGVGLHSYGFTEGALFNLGLACTIIFVLTVIPSSIIYFRDRVAALK